ncbi:hypothetical protein JTE90_019794 [Oedothorax gibbosus]|uniref:DM domain-containing protein n=1 Tax=Oedothorax gibbosus TaxID=931172 RepID=A0AAV6V708_9ARAC|nr:hypothetical protein JTE90_019794 [Oedothorax gibbosus]
MLQPAWQLASFRQLPMHEAGKSLQRSTIQQPMETPTIQFRPQFLQRSRSTTPEPQPISSPNQLGSSQFPQTSTTSQTQTLHLSSPPQPQQSLALNSSPPQDHNQDKPATYPPWPFLQSLSPTSLQPPGILAMTSPPKQQTDTHLPLQSTTPQLQLQPVIRHSPTDLQTQFPRQPATPQLQLQPVIRHSPTNLQQQFLQQPPTSRTQPTCGTCLNHGKKTRLKGHKRFCPYKNCKCELCKGVVEVRIASAQRTMATRLLKDKPQVNAQVVCDIIQARKAEIAAKGKSVRAESVRVCCGGSQTSKVFCMKPSQYQLDTL